MEITREALKIFIQSLPIGCHFSIISFGSDFSFSKIDGKNVIPYNDRTMEIIHKEIETFSSDYGGTDILNPLVEAINIKNKLEKRIFLLTDGQVSNNREIVDYVKANNHLARVHTFGIGSGCDKNLVRCVAEAGRGSANFTSDNSTDLSGQVVESLKRAFEPSLKACSIMIGKEKTQLNELFRDQAVQ